MSPKVSKTVKKPQRQKPRKGGTKVKGFTQSQGKGAPSGMKKKLVVKVQEGLKWYEILQKSSKEEPSRTQLSELPPVEDKPLTKEELSEIESKAAKFLDEDSQIYRQECLSGSKKGDFSWMDKIMKTGTLSDKMAAFIVRVQDSPVHNLNLLQQLLAMVKVQGRQQCLMTADTARDLFIEDLLPPGRKLITFEKRGPQLRRATNKELVIWLFEHRLKLQYQAFLEALKNMSVDQVDKMRSKAINVLSQLLIAHPEQEQTLLQLLVNKLGDPVKKIASKTIFQLQQVLRKHPLMKLVVVQEVERLMFRNNIGKKAQYYGICFLNTIMVTHAECQLAVKLVNVCLGFFKACVKLGEIDSKMMTGLLNGVNKAFPIAKMIGIEFQENLDTLFKIVQMSHFTISVQALSLLFHVIDYEKKFNLADRFYNALYRKLTSDDLFSTAHSLAFINLIFKAMKRDNSQKRVLGFTKRLLQVCGNAPPNVTCAILYLISEVNKVDRGVLLLGVKQGSEAVEGPIEVENDSSEVQQSISSKPIDMKKLTQTTNIQIQEGQNEVKGRGRNSHSQQPVIRNDDDDMKQEGEQSIVEIKEEGEQHCRLTEYDPTARNAKFTGAEFTFAYELVVLTKHVHPSVALFAQTLLRNERISYTGNPLKDFTISRFLERFVFRNPKANKGRQQYQPDGLRSVPVNSNNYLEAKESEIPVEEKFFYKFFKSKKTDSPRTIKKEKDDDFDSDAESIDDDEFDDIMSNYFKSHGTKSTKGEMSEDEDIDFAMDVKKAPKSKRKRDEEDETDAEDDESVEANGDSFDDADEFIQLGSDDEPEIEGDDDDSDNEDDFLQGNISDEDNSEFADFGATLLPHNKKRKHKFGATSTFAPAEQFSEILEANADMAFAGSNDLINKDNANTKQLKWELERDRWVKGLKRHQRNRRPGRSSVVPKRRRTK